MGVAVREFPLTTGDADYMLYVDGRAIGVVEAKPEGHTLSDHTLLHRARTIAQSANLHMVKS